MIPVKTGGLDHVPFTFMGLDSSYEDSTFVLVGVPYDSTSSWAPGSRFGPSSVIKASRFMDHYDIELGCTPSEAGIYTIHELDVLELPVEAMVGRVQGAVQRILSDGKKIVLVGGEHTISLGGVRAVSGEVDLFLSLDAHPDFYDEYERRRISHATVSRRVSEEIREVVVAGVRTMSWEESEDLKDARNVTVLTYSGDRDSLLRQISELIEGKRIYLSLDVDVLDPAHLPCVGTPEPGGLSYLDLISILRTIFSLSEVSVMDVVEFNPCPGMRSDAFTVSKLIYKSMAYWLVKDGEGKDLGCSSNDLSRR